MEIPAIIAIVLVTFVTRLVPRLLSPESVGSDSYFHMGMGRVIRDNGYRIPDRVPRVMVCPRYTYPYLFHWLLSFVPERHLMLAERLASPIIDSLYVLATFLFAFEIDRTFGFSDDPTSTALWTSVLVAISPALLGVGAGPRAYNATPRTLGQLFFLVYICGTALWGSTGNTSWLLLGGVAVAALSITSKFGNQAVVFIASGTVVLGYMEPILVALFGYILSIITTRGRVLAVIKGQVAHSRFYFRYLQRPYLYPHRRTFFQYARNLTSYLKNAARSPLNSLRWFFWESYFFHHIFVYYPHALVIAILLLRGEALPNGDSASLYGFHFMLDVIAVSFLVSLLTSFKHMMFLGEAQRYAEHTVMFQVLIFVFMAQATDLELLKWLILGYSVLAYVVNVEAYVSRHVELVSLRRDMELIVKDIDREGIKIFWLGHVFWPLFFFTRKAKILIHGGNFDERLLSRDDWFEVFGNFPYPGRPIGDVIRRYAIDYLVSNRDTITRYEDILKDRSFSQGRFRAVSSSGDLLLFDGTVRSEDSTVIDHLRDRVSW